MQIAVQSGGLVPSLPLLELGKRRGKRKWTNRAKRGRQGRQGRKMWIILLLSLSTARKRSGIEKGQKIGEICISADSFKTKRRSKRSSSDSFSGHFPVVRPVLVHALGPLGGVGWVCCFFLFAFWFIFFPERKYPQHTVRVLTLLRKISFASTEQPYLGHKATLKLVNPQYTAFSAPLRCTKRWGNKTESTETRSFGFTKDTGIYRIEWQTKHEANHHTELPYPFLQPLQPFL